MSDLDIASGRKSLVTENCIATMRPEERQRFLGEAEALVRFAGQARGESAFEYTQTAAAAHEAGHAVLFRDEGVPVTAMRIWHQTYAGRRVWLGRTDGAPAWRSDTSTLPEADLAVARGQIAGVCGELLLEGSRFRHGSSIDEVVLFRMLVRQAALKRRLGERQTTALAAEQLAIVMTTLQGNIAALRALAGTLMRRGQLRGRRLDTLLANVRRA